MVRDWGIVMLVLVQAVLISSIPILIDDGQEEASKDNGKARGMISNFYAETMQKFPAEGQGSSSNIIPAGQDFGDKFTDVVVKTALALGDLGIHTVQQILTDIGSELVEALRMRRSIVP